MESRIFTARISDQEMVHSGQRVEDSRLAAMRWEDLKRDLCHYLAENLPTDMFQLFRVHRISHHDPHQRCTVLLLALEAGNVIQHSFVHVTAAHNDMAEIEANRHRNDMIREDLRPQTLRPTLLELQAIQDLQNAMGNSREFGLMEEHPNQAAFDRAFGIAKQTPEDLPISGRKVLVDKHHQPA